MPAVVVNTDVDVAQSAALDALSYFRDRARTPRHADRMYSNILVGLPIDLTPIQAAVLLHEDPVTVACVIEYIVLVAVHEQAQIDRED